MARKDSNITTPKTNSHELFFYANHTAKEVFLSDGRVGVRMFLGLLEEGRWTKDDRIEVSGSFPDELRRIYNEVWF